MKLSGFTFCRNALSLHYPVIESILSALPLVDEFIVVVGKGNEDDLTVKTIRDLQNPKIKLIETEWDIAAFPRGMIHAQQTELAMRQCTGDWLIYLQADEVLHEDDLPKIKARCLHYLDDPKVEGMLCNYHHFWGDYEHLVEAHGWYPYEIRIVRNNPNIHSWESAQSFRWIPSFDGRSFRDKSGSRKLNVVDSGARVFHYGWVRPPQLMTAKMQAMDLHHGHTQQRFTQPFEFGNMKRLRRFEAKHPQVMEAWMNRLDWKSSLDYSGNRKLVRKHRFKHERLRYRILHWIEQHLFGGKEIFAYQNYRRID